MHPHWIIAPGYTEESLGLIPLWLSTENPASAVDQINANYAHGGGWRDFKGFFVNQLDGLLDPLKWRLKYPGDPAYHPIGCARLRDEVVVMWPHSWATVHNLSTETFRCARID